MNLSVGGAWAAPRMTPTRFADRTGPGRSNRGRSIMDAVHEETDHDGSLALIALITVSILLATFFVCPLTMKI